MDYDEHEDDQDDYEVLGWKGDPVEEEDERWQRWRQNSYCFYPRGIYVRRAAGFEPDLLKIFELARRSQRVEGFDRSHRYSELKQLIELLVGGLARRHELRESAYYDAALIAMEGLLPDDLGDDPELRVYPGEDVVATILATRPILPLSRPISIIDYVDPESAAHAEIKAQMDADLAWLHDLKITPHRLLEARQ